jgi:diguanylate cyclase (GGDEF)-like protein/PAS domain S-box-containing protein
MRISLRLILAILLLGSATFMTLLGLIVSYQQVTSQVIEKERREIFNELNLIQSEFEKLLVFKHPEGINQSVAARSVGVDVVQIIVTREDSTIFSATSPDYIDKNWQKIQDSYSVEQYLWVKQHYSPKVLISNDQKWIDGMVTICQSDLNRGLRSQSCGVAIYRKDLSYHINFATQSIVQQSLYMVIGGIISVLFLLLITHFLITQRVIKIKTVLQSWVQGNRNICIDIDGTDELHDISESINELVTRFSEEELALQLSEQFNKAIINSADYSIISTDVNGLIKSFNTRAEKLLGYESEEMINKNSPALFHDSEQIVLRAAGLSKMLKQDIQPGFEVFTAIARTGKVYQEEWVYIHKDGRKIPVNLSITALYDHEKNINGYLGIAYDITAQKEAERKLHLADKVFNNTSEAIVVTDQKLLIVNTNQAYSDITGYTEQEALGKKIDLTSSGKYSKKYYQAMWHSIKQNGYWSGEIWDRRKDGQIFPCLLTINEVKMEGGGVCNYVGIFKDITQQKLAAEELEKLAYHDQLTKLANRVLFGELLKRAIQNAKRNKCRFVLMYMDLNRFKYVNDTYGHEVGDELLILVADRLRNCVREADTVARMGGDEFAILLSEQADKSCLESSAKIADKICDAIATPFEVGENQLSIGVSVGLAVYPENGTENAQLLKNADFAMYKAKTIREGGYYFFTHKKSDVLDSRLK